MSQLTTNQLDRLQTALLDALNHVELSQLVRLDLDQKLDAIAGGAAFSEIVFNLLQWAQRHQRSHVQTSPSASDLTKALAPLLDAVQNASTSAAQTAAQQQLADLTQELAKGQSANDSRVAAILDDLAKLVPSAVTAIVSAFASPLLGGLSGPVTQFVLDRVKRNQP